MSQLYPLRFQPTFRNYLWGGKRLGTLLGKPIGNEGHYAESWEVVDHGADQSVVSDGTLAGKTLAEIVTNFQEELFGKHAGQKRFPLLLKYLDAEKNLSVQVHPNDAQASLLDPPDLGKTEAWVIVHAEPGSRIYAGLKPSVDRKTLEKAIQEGTSEDCVASFEPKIGDCVFLPAGVVHAIGSGLVIAEIQQASDVTYRLYDWGRVDAQGKSRELHIEPALDVIDYQKGPVVSQVPTKTDNPSVSQLVDCDKFLLNRWKINTPNKLGGDGKFHIVTVLQGEMNVEGDPSGESLGLAQTVLLPAELGEVTLTPSGEVTFLEASLPD